MGILVFGSWARGKARDSSDIDLLIVVNKNKPISRGLYRSWQAVAKDEVGRCEPHFVHLPQDLKRISGLWAEVAVDGLLVSDAQGEIHKFLIAVRRAIASGQLSAKKVHGQTYWLHSEVA